MLLPRWLKRFGKRQQQREKNHIDFPTFTTEAGAEYVPRQDYATLEERISTIERKFAISQIPIDKLEFPADVLASLPAVVKKTIEGIIFNYEHDFPDFCFWGMRKALIDAVRIRFQRDEKESLLYDGNGDSYGLPKWIELAKQERHVSGKIASELLSKVRVFGDTASHDFMANLQKEEVPSIFICLRIALSRMFYNADST